MEAFITPTIVGLVLAIIGAGYLWLKGKYLNKWLEKTELDELVEAAVVEVKLKVMEALEKANEDGKITADELRAALDVGVAAFKDMAKARKKEYLLALVNDQFIRGLIFKLLDKMGPVGTLAAAAIPRL